VIKTVNLDFSPPRLSLRFVSVWRRNALVWRKSAGTSLLANLGDPLIYLLALGYGLGALIPQVQGVPYITFLAAGSIAFSTMNTATFEAFYSAFSRMHVQKTWDAIMNAPLDLDDIVLAEAVFAATKAFAAGTAILLIATLLGVVRSPVAVLILLVLPVVGLCFACLGLMITALARMYDFFTYYFTLVVTPMAMMSGVFFPIEQLPPAMQAFSQLLPLAHAVQVIRPLMLGEFPPHAQVSLVVLLAYTIVGFYAALILLRRRLAS
jgi:lipooligosaccharide transport system permease protein